jgi:uncharacterized alkaline shock family protein YloU
MGTNISRSFSDVTQRIDNELSTTTSASANVQCGISVGDITLRNARRCSVRNQNRCGASASANIDAISKAAADAFQNASADLKTKLLPGININDTTQNIQTTIRNTIAQNCQTDATTALNISTGNLTLDGCEDSQIININTGNAESNCGIRTVLDTINKAGNEVRTEASTSSLTDGIWGNNPLYLGLSSLVSIIICMIFCSIIVLGILYVFYSK